LKIILLTVLITLTTACREENFPERDYQYKVPLGTNDGWPVAALPPQQIDTGRVFGFMRSFVKEDHQLSSMLFIQNGVLMLEEYFNDTDREDLNDLRSATKSIRSLLVGIALEKGYIQSLDEPILNYLEDLEDTTQLDPAKREITVRDLLLMSPGFDCNDWDQQSAGQEDRIYKKNDWLRYIMQLPMQYTPGDTSLYCSAATILTAEIVSRASGMTVEDFADQYLFAPLEIYRYEWGHTSRRNVPESARRLYMRSRDFAKIGQLVLDSGRWNGQQVVAKDWIEESTRKQTTITGIDYGYLWWRIPFQAEGERVEAIEAMGNGGQYLMLFPDQEVLLVFNGTAFNSEEDKLPFSIVSQVFLPALEVFEK